MCISVNRQEDLACFVVGGAFIRTALRTTPRKQQHCLMYLELQLGIIEAASSIETGGSLKQSDGIISISYTILATKTKKALMTTTNPMR